MVPKKTQERINDQFMDELNEEYEKIIDCFNSISFECTLNLVKCLIDENFIKKIFINNKTLTILFFNGEHVCAKCSDEDEYSVFLGFCVAITKYILGMNAKHIREMILDKVDPKKKDEVAENLKRGTNTVRNLINSECIKYKYQNITFDCVNGKIIIEGKEPREPDPELLKNFNTWSATNQLDEILSDERNKNEEE